MNSKISLEEMCAEYLRIYKFVNHSKIVEILNKELGGNSDIKKKIYELSDGSRSTRDIQKIVEISPPTITAYWKQWALAGIVIPAERKGRYKAAFNLKEYGLSVFEEPNQGDE